MNNRLKRIPCKFRNFLNPSFIQFPSSPIPWQSLRWHPLRRNCRHLNTTSWWVPSPLHPDRQLTAICWPGPPWGLRLAEWLAWGGRELYQSGLSIPSASYVHFGGLLGGVGLGAVAGQSLNLALDAPTRGVLGGIGGLTFALDRPSPLVTRLPIWEKVHPTAAPTLAR